MKRRKNEAGPPAGRPLEVVGVCPAPPPSDFNEADATPQQGKAKLTGLQRARVLSGVADGLLRAGFDEDQVRARLASYNQDWCDPPVSPNELESALEYARALNKQGKKEDAEIDAISWPDPPDEPAFYGLAGDIVRLIEPHSEADRVALLLQFLVAFGNAAGRHTYYLVEEDRHYPNLFVVLVGATAKARKGTSWSRVRHIFSLADESWARGCLETGLSSGEGVIWRLRDPIVLKGKVTDEGTADKRLLVIEPEFASVLKVLAREGNTLSPVLRGAWDTGFLTTLVKNNRAKASDAHVSIIAHVTKPEVLRYLDATEQANGFANRFLWCCVKRSKYLPEGGGASANLEPLVTRLKRALDFARSERRITWDDEARREWHRVYPALSEGKPGLLGAMIARAEAQVVRLASIYALLDSSPVIEIGHLTAALRVWDYCERSARFIFGASLGDPVADEILRALRNAPDGLTRTDISDLFGRHRRAGELSRALGTLLELGLARREQEQTGGRPTERWYALTVSAEAKKAKEAKKGPGAEGLSSLNSLISQPDSVEFKEEPF